MKTNFAAIAASLFLTTCIAWAASDPSHATQSGVAAAPAQVQDRPELAYLWVLNEAGPVRDPQLIFLLAGQFANAGRAGEGANFFEGLIHRYSPQMSDLQRAVYLTALAQLRAQHADQVMFLKRFGWVRDTVAMLDEAKRLSKGELFVTRWMSGIVRAQLPSFFGESAAALDDLQWCEANATLFPHAGWLREVYYQRARLAERDGKPDVARKYLELSGLSGMEQPITYTTPIGEEARNGHTFAPRKITEPVPGRVFALSGFEFTEYYFVISQDGKELIAIDAGTRPDSAKQAFEALRQHVKSLPPLTTLFITHAHWDHVGGHRYFRSIAPNLKIYGRSNFAAEIRRDLEAPRSVLAKFFGESFSMDDVKDYHPDVPVQASTEVRVGGTRFELLPTAGGETDDAMLINMPDAGVMFTGDIIMPYLGAPFVQEGSLEGLLQSIKDIDQRHPRILLHGHEPLTRIFDSTVVLDELAGHLSWLSGQVIDRIGRGQERGEIQQANLTPPDIVRSSPNTQLGYLVLRENVINRLFEQHVGYWQSDLQGMDSMTLADRGSILVDYLQLSDGQIAQAASRLIAHGKHEQAAALVQWVQARKAPSPELAAQGRTAYMKLMEKFQDFSPFKYIVYADRARVTVPQMGLPASNAGGSH